MQCVGGGEISDNKEEADPLAELKQQVVYISDLYIWMFDLSIFGWILAAVSILLGIVPVI